MQELLKIIKELNARVIELNKSNNDLCSQLNGVQKTFDNLPSNVSSQDQVISIQCQIIALYENACNLQKLINKLLPTVSNLLGDILVDVVALQSPDNNLAMRVKDIQIQTNKIDKEVKNVCNNANIVLIDAITWLSEILSKYLNQ
jgi:hypothetical protein